MTEDQTNRLLGELLSGAIPEPDAAFVDRVVLAARIDQQFRISRRKNLRRALIESGIAIAVGASFYLMSQMNGAVTADGQILVGGPAMAGLLMLGLWSLVALPGSRVRTSLLSN